MIDIARKILEARKASRLSQIQFCDYYGLSLRTLREIEKGNSSVNFANLLKIIQACDLKPELIKMQGGDTAKISSIFPEVKLQNKQEAIQKLAKIKPLLEEKAELKKIGIFGSFSRGDTKARDIDILAVVENYDLHKDAYIYGILTRALGLPNVDLTVIEEEELEESRFGKNIKKDILYA